MSYIEFVRAMWIIRKELLRLRQCVKAMARSSR
jgi:hypothetical protein